MNTSESNIPQMHANPASADTFNTTTKRSPVLYTLAGFGFVAILVAAMWFAIYSTRFVPTVANRIGSATAYIGSVFTPGPNEPNPSLSVVPAASTTLPFENGTTTDTTTDTTSPATTTPSKPTPTTKPSKPVAPSPGQQTSGTYPIGGTGAPTLSGLPDLATTIDAVGYLATTSTNSFVASATVPAGARPAVRFTIKNIGTNVAGTWRFSASIPTATSYLYQSLPQQPLNPGDSIDYTLGFDQANRGSNKTISISANFDNKVTELTTNNNSASASVTILGN